MNKLIIPTSFYEEEIRNGYTISSKMKKVWAVQLGILYEVQKVCEKHQIKYFAIGGTLLGAVRHNGYIPWDDDLDIAMYREDYNKFCEVAPKELSTPFFFQTEETDPGYLLRHAKVRNSDTTGILTIQKDKKYKFNQGIFVDLFPLDKLPDDINERNMYFKELYSAWGEVYKYSAYLNRNEGELEKYNISLENISETSKRYNIEYENLTSKYSKQDTKESCLLAVTIQSKKILHNWILKNEDFDNIKYLPFEFLSIPVPSNFENVLNHTYGNWKEFVVSKNFHGEVLFDTSLSYITYLKSLL